MGVITSPSCCPLHSFFLLGQSLLPRDPQVPSPLPPSLSPFGPPGSEASTCEWIVETNNLIHLFFHPEREGEKKEGHAGTCVHCLCRAVSRPAHHLPGRGRAAERGRGGWRWGKSSPGSAVLLGEPQPCRATQRPPGDGRETVPWLHSGQLWSFLPIIAAFSWAPTMCWVYLYMPAPL